MGSRVTCLGWLTLALVIESAAAADSDWPQWRGPKRDGISSETGLLKEWPAGGPARAWKITGLGGGYSGVAVADGIIYTMGEDKESSYVHALQVKDGKTLWSTKAGKAGAPGWGGFAGPRATPTVDGDRVYALSHYGELVCLETANGKEVWHKDFVADFGAKMPEWAFAESPLVDGNQVICTPGGAQGCLVALDKKSGNLIWRTKDFTDHAHYSSVIVAEIDGVRQYIQLTDASVVGVAENGKVLWRAPRQGSTAVIPTPIYHDHHVFVTSGYGAGCNLFKIAKTEGGFKAEQVYANKDLENHHGGVVRVGDYLYGHCDNKGWRCMEFKTGKVIWTEKAKQIKGSICGADGLLYLRGEEREGTLVLIEATPTGFVEKGRFDQPDRSGKNSWPHPVIANGKLYLRDQDLLLCYNLRK